MNRGLAIYKADAKIDLLCSISCVRTVLFKDVGTVWVFRANISYFFSSPNNLQEAEGKLSLSLSLIVAIDMLG